VLIARRAPLASNTDGDLDVPFFVGRNRYRPYWHGWPLTVAIQSLHAAGDHPYWPLMKPPSVGA
jgi:hypothetical protein